MSRTIEAEVDEQGLVRPKKPLKLPAGSRVLVTVPESNELPQTALLAETSLAGDWLRPEEDEAWSHLNRA